MAGLLTFAWSTGVLMTLAQDFQDTQMQAPETESGESAIPSPLLQPNQPAITLSKTRCPKSGSLFTSELHVVHRQSQLQLFAGLGLGPPEMGVVAPLAGEAGHILFLRFATVLPRSFSFSPSSAPLILRVSVGVQ